jgi:phytanoyl-CoA hydroxylase
MTMHDISIPVADDRDAVELAVQEAVATFSRDGIVVLRQLVSADLIDSAREIMQSADENSPFSGFIKGKFVSASEENQQHHRFRFKDIYINHKDSREAIFSPFLIDVLAGIAGEPVLAFQSQGFIRGSGLRIHRDSNFLVVDKSESVIGVWLALEDIEEGMGELVYYPGSHHFPAYEMSEGSLQRVRDPGQMSYSNDEYIDYLYDQIRLNRLEDKHFTAKKGDCLVWHADMVHAGSPVTRVGSTRYSFVTHFCPVSAQPHYFGHFKNAAIVRHSDKASFSSLHYNLKDISDSSQLEGKVIPPRTV